MLKIICSLGLFINLCYGANILGIWFHAGKSHHILGEMLLKELARRGHNVTMASPFPLKEAFPNYTDIYLTGIMEDQISREEMFMEMNKGHNLVGVNPVLELTRSQTELTLNHTEMKKLLDSGTKFDLIIIDWFMNFAILLYGHLLDAPVIPIASHGTTVLANNIVGNPSPPSYISSALFAFPSNMTFFQRVANTLVAALYNVAAIGNKRYHMNLVEKYCDKKPVPSFEELSDRVAVVLTNGHYSYEYPRPYVPNLIPVGGFHVQKSNKLPEELETFLSGGKDGSIFFSLGSNMKSTLLPKSKRQEIMNVFSKLPNYNILWKWEEDDLPGKPKNVKIAKWLPQNDILAHPSIKLFISHGGLLSTIESISHGVPVLGIPIFGDQKTNIPIAVNNGYAIHLELSDLTEDKFLEVLHEILNNSKYRENAKRRSELLKDQPLSPMDTAVYWVEHVIRHKGAPHLKNSGMYLNWFQYLLLDVILFIVLVLATMYYITKKVLSYLCNRIKRIFYKSKKD